MALVVSPREIRQLPAGPSSPAKSAIGSQPLPSLKPSSSRFFWIASSFISQSEREVAMLQANLQSGKAYLDANTRLVENAKARERSALKRIHQDFTAIKNANARRTEAEDEARVWREKLEQAQAELRAMNEKMQQIEEERDEVEKEGRELRQVVRRQIQDLRMQDARSAGREEGRVAGYASGMKDGRVEGFIVGRRDSTQRAASIKSYSTKSSSTSRGRRRTTE